MLPDSGFKHALTIIIFVVLIVILASGAANTGLITAPAITVLT